MKRFYNVGTSAGLLLLVLLLGGCASGLVESQPTPTPYPTPVRTTYTVQRGDIVINVAASGDIEARALETVSFSMDGTVGKVYVQLNESVTKGELLADLQELAGLQAQAQAAGRAVQRAEINVEIAQELLAKDQAEGASPYDVKIQALQVQLAQLDLADVLSKYGLADSTTSLEAINAQLNQARVFAPIDGVIISEVNPGQSVTTGTTAFTIGDPKDMDMVATLATAEADSQLKQMYEGMPVTVSLDATPDVSLSGKIRQLPSPYGTGDPNTNIIRVAIDQAPSKDTYQAGDKATVHIQLANRLGVLWLPPAAVHQVGGRTFVVVTGPSGLERVDITIGLQTADKVEILSGLSAGQVVIGQ
jgi:RND family efflux transporter MFP subunit